jgi:hypothetical protein
VEIAWVHVRRRPNWPWWSILLVVLWTGLGSANLLLAASAGQPQALCLFKHLTGRPCPTCGFTRGALLLLSGHPIQGWLHNPLLFSLLAGFAVMTGVRVVLARGLTVRPRRQEKKAVWIMALVLFALNWLYVIRYVG